MGTSGLVEYRNLDGHYRTGTLYDDVDETGASDARDILTGRIITLRWSEMLGCWVEVA